MGSFLHMEIVSKVRMEIIPTWNVHPFHAHEHCCKTQKKKHSTVTTYRKAMEKIEEEMSSHFETTLVEDDHLNIVK